MGKYPLRHPLTKFSFRRELSYVYFDSLAHSTMKVMAVRGNLELWRCIPDHEKIPESYLIVITYGNSVLDVYDEIEIPPGEHWPVFQKIHNKFKQEFITT